MPYQILITCTRRSLSSNAVITWLSGGNHSSSPLVFSGVRVAQSLVFYVVFCRSLFVRLSFFHVIHCIYCLSLFDLRLLITPFVSSNSNWLMLSSHITWITTFYFIRVIIWCHVTYHILFHQSYHLISRNLPHPISSELSSYITWLTTSYFIGVIIFYHVTYHILFHRSYHLISRDLPHPISSELSSDVTWLTTSYFIGVIILYHVTYHILFHRSYHLISRDLPHPISSELSSQSLSPSHLYEPGIQLPLSHVNASVRNVHVYKFIYY